jgi:hypothetical protein
MSCCILRVTEGEGFDLSQAAATAPQHSPDRSPVPPAAARRMFDLMARNRRSHARYEAMHCKLLPLMRIKPHPLAACANRCHGRSHDARAS